MIDFNDSRISEDGKRLILDLNIQDLNYYDDMYLGRIVIDTQDTWIPSGPSQNPVYEWEDPTPVFVNGNLVNRRHLRLELTSTDLDGLSLGNNMFYVYVIAEGMPAPNTPCGLDEATSLRVVFDYGVIYRNTIKLFKQLSEDCIVPQALINQILQLNGLELSLITRHYPESNRFWNKFFKNKKANLPKTKCGCNG